MSSIDKAVQVILAHDADGACNEPECLAQDLADAGLLMPDLPEPTRAWGDDDAPLKWALDDKYNPFAVIVNGRRADDPVSLEDFNRVLKRLTAAEAHYLALALLAAAQWAEQNGG